MSLTTIPFQTSVQGMIKRLLNDKILTIHGAGGPLSGIAPYATGAGICGLGSKYINNNNGARYVNQGDTVTVYWYPDGFEQQGILGAYTDFKSGIGAAIATTDASTTLENGIRIHGQGLAEADAGGVVAYAEDGPVMALTTTDEAAHLTALSQAGTSPWFQPNSHGPIVVEARVAQVSAIDARSLFIGFLGTIADALDPAVTGATITATLVQDDLAGFGFDAGFTDADRFYAFHNKSDEAASVDVTTGSRDLGVDCPAAATYCVLRVEISAAGVMTCFKDKVLLLRKEAALDIDEEVAPTVYIRSLAAAVKTMNVKHFGFWGTRN